MDKFESLIITDGTLSDKVRIYLGGNPTLNKILKEMYLKDAITYLGDQGWELVSFVPSSYGNEKNTAAFKRKKQK